MDVSLSRDSDAGGVVRERTDYLQGVGVKIVSDGTSLGTKVFDDSGNEIRFIQGINWHIDVHGVATATITVLDVELDVVSDVVRIVKKSID